jgi:hypothetical protein
MIRTETPNAGPQDHYSTRAYSSGWKIAPRSCVRSDVGVLFSQSLSATSKREDKVGSPHNQVHGGLLVREPSCA